MTAAVTDRADGLAQRRWLAAEADWIASATRAADLGRRARRAYLDRTQIRNLQRVGETALSVTSVMDYVKTQVGLHPQWRRENVGLSLLDELDHLRQRAPGEPAVAAAAHLVLCRLYLRQVAASYVYSIAVDATTRPAAPPRPAPEAAPADSAVRGPRTRPARPARPASGERPPRGAPSAAPEAAASDAGAEEGPAAAEAAPPPALTHAPAMEESTAPPAPEASAEGPLPSAVEGEPRTGEAVTAVSDAAVAAVDQAAPPPDAPEHVAAPAMAADAETTAAAASDDAAPDGDAPDDATPVHPEFGQAKPPLTPPEEG